MGAFPIGGYREGTSPLHRSDALCKLIALLVTLTAVLLTESVWGYILLTAGLLTAVRISRLGLRDTLRSIAHMRLFFLLVFLMNALFYEGGTEPVSWWIFRFSTEGMIAGGHIAARMALAIVLGQLFCAVTSPLAIIEAVQSLLRPLQILHIPVQDIAMILGVAMQFIPIFSEEAEMIRRAQIARGARFESRRLIERGKSMLPLVVPIFLAAFRRADELSVAMEARGYRRRAGRLPKIRRRVTAGAVLLLGISVLLCAAAIPL